MARNVRDAIDPSKQTQVDLLVEVSGLNITVKAGSMVIAGKPVVLSKDTVYKASTHAQLSWLRGFLVRERTTGNVTVLVDEYVVDGEDSPFEFLPTCPYDPLYALYAAKVPSGTTDLANADFTLFRHVPPKEKVLQRRIPPPQN